MLEWVFGDPAAVQLVLKYLLKHIPVSNPNKAKTFLELDFGGTSTLVCHRFPMWGKWAFVQLSPGIVSHKEADVQNINILPMP